MKHLSEEQLVLYHYGEGPGGAAAEAHLAGCAPCRAQLESLRRVLAAVEAAPVPERGEGYGREVWARLQPRLAEPPPSRWAGFLSPRRWALAGSVAALVLAAFLAGRFWPRPATEAISLQVRERILLVAVGDHLERSEMVLIELVNAPGNGSVDISAEKRWAEELVGANRLYRQTAARAGEAGVASVLDDLERVLLEIANSPDKISSPELTELRQRIEAKGILFKVRVISSEVREREKAAVAREATGRT